MVALPSSKPHNQEDPLSVSPLEGEKVLLPSEGRIKEGSALRYALASLGLLRANGTKQLLAAPFDRTPVFFG